MMKFDYGSMAKKYEGFTGRKWNFAGGNIASDIKKNFPMVSLEGKTGIENEMDEVRDWCQEHFGDRWIYDWNDFYFHTQKDAAWFSLRWT
jgi:hypothetical protein